MSRCGLPMGGMVGTVGIVAAGLLLTGCTPDVTRERLEADVAVTYPAALRLSADLAGRPVVDPQVTSTVCHSQTNTRADSGPGPWTCTVGYVLAGVPHSTTLGLTVDTLGCYAATDVARRDAVVVDVETGQRIADPAVGFDGCFAVGDDRTGIQNGPNGSR